MCGFEPIKCKHIACLMDCANGREEKVRLGAPEVQRCLNICFRSDAWDQGNQWLRCRQLCGWRHYGNWCSSKGRKDIDDRETWAERWTLFPPSFCCPCLKRHGSPGRSDKGSLRSPHFLGPHTVGSHESHTWDTGRVQCVVLTATVRKDAPTVVCETGHECVERVRECTRQIAQIQVPRDDDDRFRASMAKRSRSCRHFHLRNTHQ